MRKGEATREAILEHAVGLARRVGLEGLTIGRLADDLDLSKSGLFAHFHSKEALQVQVLEAAADRFVDVVLKPALAVARGEPRVRALFDRWLEWERRPGGCVFVQAAADLDDREARRANGWCSCSATGWRRSRRPRAARSAKATSHRRRSRCSSRTI